MLMWGLMSFVNVVLVEIGKVKEFFIELVEMCGYYEFVLYFVKWNWSSVVYGFIVSLDIGYK